MKRLQYRIATAAEFTAKDPVLARDEIGIEKDTGKEKIGNGTSRWSLLAYFPDTATDPTRVLKAGDTMVGNLIMASGATVSGLPNATSGSQAVNKDQLDTKVTLTGDESISGTKTFAGQVVVPAADGLRSGAQHTQNDGVFSAVRDGHAMVYLSPNGTGSVARVRGWAADGTWASKTAVGASRVITEIDARGWGGSGYRGSAFIQMGTDANPGSYTYSDTSMPGRIALLTTPNSGITAAERLVIDSTGLVTVNNGLKIVGGVSGLVATSVDNTLPRFDGTTGALQGSGVTIDDNSDVTGVRNLHASGAENYIRVSSTTVGASAYLDGGASGQWSQVMYRTIVAGVPKNRWALWKTDTSESGSDAGSNLKLTRYNDAGSSLGDALTIVRATGRLDAPYTVQSGDASSTVVNKAYVDARVSAPDSGWTTISLQNSWTNYSAGTYGAAAYHKDALGWVTLRGMIAHTTAGYTGAFVQLPVGYRPAYTQIFASWSVFSVVQITVNTDGTVAPTYYPSGAGSGAVSLNSVRFATF